MNGLLLGHLLEFMVILYDDMPAIEICMKPARPKHTDRHYHSIFV